jgi:hypothetical protein
LNKKNLCEYSKTLQAQIMFFENNICTDLYWRYVPDPPVNCGYNVG